MRFLISYIIFMSCFIMSYLDAGSSKEAPIDYNMVQFTPPEGWSLADLSKMPSSVKTMVVGKSETNFPPSISLVIEPYDGTLKQYLKIVQQLNLAQGSNWKEIKKLRTAAGDASLSQVDTVTEWGTIHLIHLILKRDKNIYILTATAKKEEFPKFYKTFFDSLLSIRFTSSPLEMAAHLPEFSLLKSQISRLQQNFRMTVGVEQKKQPNLEKISIRKNIFNNEEFQNKYWVPFQDFLEKKFESMGNAWKALLLNMIKDNLINDKSM